MASAKTLMKLPDSAAGEMLKVQIAAVWASIKDEKEQQDKQVVAAVTAGIAPPAEAGLAGTVAKLLVEWRPGLKETLTRSRRPSREYLGVILNFFVQNDPRSERLSQISTTAMVESVKQSAGVHAGILDLSMPDPKGKNEYTEVMKTMGFGWVGVALYKPTIAVLEGLTLETFSQYAEFVMGPSAGGVTREDGTQIPWPEVMTVDQEVRSWWWDTVERQKVTLNTAILDSIGVNASGTPCGIWQNRLVNKLSLMNGKGNKRTAAAAGLTQGQAQWPKKGQPGAQAAFGQGKSRGSAGFKAWMGGKNAPAPAPSSKPWAQPKGAKN